MFQQEKDNYLNKTEALSQQDKKTSSIVLTTQNKKIVSTGSRELSHHVILKVQVFHLFIHVKTSLLFEHLI